MGVDETQPGSDQRAAGVSRAGAASRPERFVAWLDRHRHGLLASVAALYAAGFTGAWRLGEDSALYLVLGRSLSRGEGYRFAGEWHQHGYPGLPMLLAPLYRVFGEATPHAATWLMMGLMAGVLGLTYRLFWLHAGRGTAVAMVVLVGVCENVYRYAFQVRNDLPFLLAVLAVLAGYEGLRRRSAGEDAGGAWRWLDGGLVVMGLVSATYLRPTMLTLHAAVVLAGAMGVAWGPRRWLHAGLIAASVASVGLFMVSDPRRAGSGGAASASAAVASESGEPRAVYESRLADKLERLPATLAEGVGERWVEASWEGLLAESMVGIELGPGVLNLGFAVVVGGSGLWLFRRRRLWGLYVAGTLGQVLFFPPLERYFLPVLPLLLYGAWRVAVWLGERRIMAWRMVGTALVVVLVAANVVLCVAFAVEQRSGDPVAAQDGGRFAAIPAMAEAVERHVPAGAVVVSDEARILTLLTERRGIEPVVALERWTRQPGRRPATAWAVGRVPARRWQRELLDRPWTGVAAVLIERPPAVETGDDPDHEVAEADMGWRLLRLRLERGAGAAGDAHPPKP